LFDRGGKFWDWVLDGFDSLLAKLPETFHKEVTKRRDLFTATVASDPRLTRITNRLRVRLSASYKDFTGALDKDRSKLVFQNGWIHDLNTNKIREVVSTDLVTFASAIKYDYDTVTFNDPVMRAKAQFILKRVFNDDEKFTTYIKRSILAALAGKNYKRALFLKGLGDNGKSVILAILRVIAGPMYGNGAAQLLTHVSVDPSKPNTALAAVIDKRLVGISETMENGEVNEGFFKLLTGSDDVNVRGLHESQVSVVVRFLLFVVTNHNVSTIGGPGLVLY
jgi:phage/plasmid-associated DNA primase